ncbi:hypothetical protein FHU41_002291 [Psychromicrobium silvestre]|uniref:DUF4190 domain-containing protein n=1 Tax=Psychromicrobium silvestre TaxID=1645614 RepID=A0A7Y9LUY0_9MICC|nr:DUF4190 domain-containing protein [Psychromicrobium silvestre]NYE96041.1 hypothetical protein [Psychromicrobium silvestre]
MSNQPEQPFQPPQPVNGYGQQPPQQYPGAPGQQPPSGYPGAFQGQNQPPMQQPYGQQPYPQQGYYSNPSYPMQPMVYADSGPKGLSLTGMILGIASIVGFGIFILPQIAGVIVSHMGWSKEQPQGKGFAIAGLVLNYLSLLIWGLVFIFMIIGFIAAANYSSNYN